MPEAKTPDLVGSAEVCRIANIDKSTLSRHVAAGKIAPRVRLPGKNGAWLFDRSDVDRYVSTIRGAA